MVKILSLVSLFTVSFPWLVFAGFEPVIPIRIYVQARIDPSGYAEPGVADSVMDLKNSIRKKKLLVAACRFTGTGSACD